MVKLFLLLSLAAIGVPGCTHNRVFVMTPHSSDESFSRLNNDLAKQTDVLVVVPDSLWERRVWEARPDTAKLADTAAEYAVSDDAYDFGEPRAVSRIQVRRDSTFYILARAATPSCWRTWHLREIYFEGEAKSRSLGMLAGLGMGAFGGTTLMAALLFSSNESLTEREEEERLIAVGVGAAVGSVVGLIGGFFYPMEVTERTRILFMPDLPPGYPREQGLYIRK